MSKVTIGALGGISQTIGQVTLPAGNTLTVNGDIYNHKNVNAMKVPTGTTAQRPSSPTAGAVRFNTFKIAFPRVDLPEPDSPTIPTV